MTLNLLSQGINPKLLPVNPPKLLPGLLFHEGAQNPNGKLQGINPKLLPVNHPKVLPGMLSQGSAIFV